MVKKILRGVGWAVCALLFVLCIFMIVISAVFGSSEIVDIFGYNLYLCGESSYAGLENGSAVRVEECEPYDLDAGNLILYSSAASDAEVTPALAYFEKAEMTDGVYYMDVTDEDGKLSTVSGNSLVGRASWSSPFLGKLISFSLSTWGICVMAVLPCLALIVYSIVKAAAENAPPPEVIPQKKNQDNGEKPASSIGVKSDGNAEYNRSMGAKANSTADGVLYTYGRSKSPAAMKPSVPEPQAETAVSEPLRTPSKQGSVPSSVAARKYIESATAAQKKAASAKPEPKPVTEAAPEPKPVVKTEKKREDIENDSRLDAILSGATAEIPNVTKKKKSDAFFTQSDAPQIGRGMRSSQNRAVIDLEDALASAGAKDSKKTEVSGRKSAAILASKSRRELITDDDDSRDRNRYDVDDILAGLGDRRR